MICIVVNNESTTVSDEGVKQPFFSDTRVLEVIELVSLSKQLRLNVVYDLCDRSDLNIAITS